MIDINGRTRRTRKKTLSVYPDWFHNNPFKKSETLQRLHLRKLHNPKPFKKYLVNRRKIKIEILTPEENRIIRDIERVNLMMTIIDQTETLDEDAFVGLYEILNDILKTLRSYLPGISSK